jgi:hypothetical protein
MRELESCVANEYLRQGPSARYAANESAYKSMNALLSQIGKDGVPTLYRGLVYCQPANHLDHRSEVVHAILDPRQFAAVVELEPGQWRKSRGVSEW